MFSDHLTGQTSSTNELLSLDQKRMIFINTSMSNSSKADLESICNKLNISSRGSKKELLIRIRSFLALDKEKEGKDSRGAGNKGSQDTKDVIVIENADEGQYLKIDGSDQEILSAEGNVHLKYNKLRLKADKVRVNNQTKEMLCEGNVILYDGAKELTGEKIFYNLDTGMGIIYFGKSRMGELIYKGEKIKKVQDDAYIISKGIFTSCDDDPPHYYIEAKKLWVYPNNKIVMLDAYYVISGVKVFWIPLFLRFEKGTGIITAWGRRDVEGWYMQNTLRFSLSQDARGNIKFDHYERRGEYGGVDIHQNSEDSEILFSASGAYDKTLYGDSNVNPDTGEVDRAYRGKASFKNRLTFNKDAENNAYNTTIRASIFRQSDYAYIKDFETYRSVKPGFHFQDSPIYRNDLYNQDVNRWYIDLSDIRQNSSFSIKADWNYVWNPILEDYRINYANLPELRYSLNGVLGESPSLLSGTSSTNTNSDTGSGFYPKIRYNTSVKLAHQDYFDENGSYLKGLDSRNFDLILSRTFGLYSFISYTPSMGLGDQAYWAYDVQESEKENYERNSYTFGSLGQGLRFGPSSVYLNFNHALRYRFKEPDELNEYGKVVSHSLGMGQRTALFSGLAFQANTSYDLRTKRGEKLVGIERDRFSDLNTQLNFSAINNVSLSERYIYSIRYDKPLTSNLNFTYTKSDIPFFLIDKIDTFSFNSVWNHNIQNPRNSNLSLNSRFSVILSKDWRFNLSTRSVNEKLYLYSRSLAKKYEIEETEKNSGEYEYRNFFTDLINSVNIFQPSKMQDSYFKLQSADISVIHDLHCWEMAFGYNLSQRYFNYGRITQYPYFEHSFYLRINMKIETEIGVDEEFQTAPPDVGE
ncbi:MAG: hypothetical protein KKH98_03015 [Spirochaetes bacterium]|nr:hypothetical protein [Spirochaetota bacterium]